MRSHKPFARPLARLGIAAALVAAVAGGAVAVTYAAEMVEGTDYGVMSQMADPAVAIELPKSVAMTVEVASNGDEGAATQGENLEGGGITANPEGEGGGDAGAGDGESDGLAPDTSLDNKLYLGYLNATGTYSNISSAETPNDTRNKTVRVQAPEVSEAAQLLGVSTTLAGGASYVDIAPGGSTVATTSQSTLAQIVATVAVPEERNAPIKTELQRLTEATGNALPSRVNSLGDYESSFSYTYFPAETTIKAVDKTGSVKSVYNKYNVIYAQLENVPESATVTVEWWSIDYWGTYLEKVGEGMTYTVTADTWAVRPVLVDKSGTYATPLYATGYCKTDVYDVFAMYSETDNSLRFYRDTCAPEVGEEYAGLKVTAVDVTIDELDGIAAYKSSVTSVKVESAITFPETSMAYYFRDFAYVDTFDLLNLNVSSVTSMEGLFYNCSRARYFDITTWDVSKVENFSYFMYNCSGAKTLNLTKFSASAALKTDYMFAGMSALTTIYVREATWTMPTVEELESSSYMFYGCSVLEGGVGTKYTTAHQDAEYARIDRADVPGYLTDYNVATKYMAVYSETDNSLRFYGTSDVPMIGDIVDGRRVTAVDTSIETLDGVAAYKSSIKKIIVMEQMQFPMTNLAQYFSYYTACTLVDLRNLDVSNITSFNHAFWYSYNIRTIIVSEANWDTSSVTDFTNMFHSTSSIRGGCGTGYNSSYISGQYAVIDKPGQPGYLTVDEYESDCFAVYSDDDKSVRLYGAGRVPLVDEVFDGRIVTGVDADLTSLDGMAPFYGTTTSITVMEPLKLPTTSMSFYFSSFSNALTFNLDGLDVSEVTNMYALFAYTYRATTITFGEHFDTRAVTDMGSMFYQCIALKTVDMQNLDVSNVIYMYQMFYDCRVITSDAFNFSTWDTSKVQSMYSMFYACYALEKIDLTALNTSSVTNMSYMFYGDSSLVEVDLTSFATPVLTSTYAMFYGCTKLTTIYANNTTWDMSKVSNSTYMFYGCAALIGGCGTPYNGSQDKTYAVVDLIGQHGYLTLRGYLTNSYAVYTDEDAHIRFYAGSDAPSPGDTLVTPEGEEVQVTRVDRSLDAINAFSGLTSKQLVVDVVDEQVEIPTTNMSFYFSGVNSAVSFDLDGLDVSKVTNMYALFAYTYYATTITFGENFDTSAVTDMASMFYQCQSLKTVDMQNLDVSNVIYMYQMFYDCRSMLGDAFNFSTWDTSNVQNMYSMFYACYALEKIDLTALNTSSVTNMSYMFYGDSSLVEVDLTSFATPALTSTYEMFRGCTKLTTINVSDALWDMSKVTNSTYMFYNCAALIGGCGTPYDGTHDKTYSKVDKVLQHGYLTDPTYETESFAVYGEDDVIRIYSTGYKFPVEGEGDGEPEATLQAAAYVARTAENAENNGEVDGGNTDNTDNAGNGGDLDVTPDASTPGESDGIVRAPKPGEEFDGVKVLAVDRSIENLNAWYGTKSSTAKRLEVIDEVTFPTTTAASWLANYYNLATVDLQKMDFSPVTTMNYMFSACHALAEVTFGEGSTRNVENMQYMFYYINNTSYGTYRILDLTTLDTSGATNMYAMFYYSYMFSDIDVSTWDTSNVTNMSYMFAICTGLKELDLQALNVSNVQYMNYMFYASSALVDINMTTWDTSNVLQMEGMFRDCISLVELNLESFDTSKLAYSWYLFYNCSKLESIYVTEALWNFKPSASYIFTGCTVLTGGCGTTTNDGTEIGVAKVDKILQHGLLTDRSYKTESFAVYSDDDKEVRIYATGYKFPVEEEEEASLQLATYEAGDGENAENNGELGDAEAPGAGDSNNATDDSTEELVKAPKPGDEFDGRTVTAVDRSIESLNGLWKYRSAATKLTVVDEVVFPHTSADSWLYYYWSSLRTIDLEKMDFSPVTSMRWTFAYTYSLDSITFKRNSTRNVKDFYHAFAYMKANGYCTTGGLDLRTLDVSGATSIYAMIYNSSGLTQVDVSTWDVSNVRDMGYAFAANPKLEALNLEGWAPVAATDVSNMFRACDKLTTIYVDDAWELPSVVYTTYTFYATPNLVGGSGTPVISDSGTYAVADTMETAGFLTNVNYVTSSFAVYTAEDYTVRLYSDTALGQDHFDSNGYLEPEVEDGEEENASDPATFSTVNAEVEEDAPEADGAEKNPEVDEDIWTREPFYMPQMPQNRRAPVVGEMFEGKKVTAVDCTLNKLDGFSNVKSQVKYVVAVDEIVAPTTTLASYFSSWSALIEADLATVDFSLATAADYMFYYNYALTAVTFKEGATRNVESTSYMFTYCYSLGDFDATTIDVSNVTNAYAMFYASNSGTECLRSLDVSTWNTSKMKNMSHMFSYCPNLTELDLTSFSLESVEYFNYVFMYDSALTTIYIDGEKWQLPEGMGANTQLYQTFYGCSALTGGCGTPVAAYGDNGAYAVNDEIGQPGYLTDTTYTTQEYAVYTAEDKTVRLYGVSGMGLTDDKNSPDYVFATAPKVGETDGAGRTVTAVDRSLDKLDGFYNYKNYNIVSVVSEDEIALPAADCSNWLTPAYNLVTIDLSRVDLSKVENMDYFLYGNSGLKEVTFKQQVSSKLTSMQYAFAGCTSLEALDVSQLITSNVTNLYATFYNCSKLTSLDLTGWDTSSVTNMCHLFSCLTAMKELDLSSLSVGSVTNADYLFYNNPNLTTIYVDKDVWNPTTAITNNSSVFTYTSKLVGGCDTASSYWGSSGAYAVVDMVGQPGYLTDKSYSTTEYAVYTAEDQTVTLYAGSDAPIAGDQLPDGRTVTAVDRSIDKLDAFYSYRSLIKKVVVADEIVFPGTSMNSYFYYWTVLESADLTKLDVSNVTTMTSIFQECYKLTDLKVAGWNTSNVTNMDYAFYYLQYLIELDLEGWDVSNVTSFYQTWYYNLALETIYVDADWTLNENVNRYTYTFYAPKLVGGSSTSYNTVYGYVSYSYYYGALYAVPDVEGQVGYLTVRGYQSPSFAIYSATDASIRLYHNSDMPAVGDTYRGRVVTAIDRNITNLYMLYPYASSATTIAVEEELTIPNRTDLKGYFSQFTYLAYWDLSKLDVSAITTLDNLFYNNGYLKTLNLAGWDVSNVTSLANVFYYCTGLTSLDLSGWNTSNVTSLSQTFYYCYNLKSIDVSGWDTSKVTTMYYAFYYCKALTTLDLSTWDTSSMTTMYCAFYYMEGLKTLDFSSASLHNVTNLSHLLCYAYALETVYVDNSRWVIPTGADTSYAVYINNYLVGGLGTSYATYGYKPEYARADMDGQPGYFTHKAASVGMANPPAAEAQLELRALALSAGLVTTARTRKRAESAA